MSSWLFHNRSAVASSMALNPSMSATCNVSGAVHQIWVPQVRLALYASWLCIMGWLHAETM